MSVSVEKFNLGSILGQISNGGSASSGLPFQIKGLDLSSINLGGASGSGGLGGGLSGLGSLFGPAGTGIGIVAGLIPGLEGFLKNGFDFSCLGGQAFDKGKLDAKLQELKQRTDKAQTSVSEMAKFLSICYDEIQQSNLEIGRYQSGCSKSLRTKYRDACQSIFDSIDKSIFIESEHIGLDWKGTQYPAKNYTPKSGAVLGQNSVASVVPTKQEFESAIPEMREFALKNNLNPDEVIEKAHQNFFGLPWGGGINGGINTDGEWHVEGSAGTKNDNTSMYLLIAGAVAFAFVMMKKK